MQCSNRAVWVMIGIWIGVLVWFSLLPMPVLAEGAATDQASTLVANDVSNYTLAEPKIFWHTGVPACPPRAGEAAPEGESGSEPPGAGREPQIASSDQDIYFERIRRIASYGSTTRTLYSKQRDCGDGEINSPLAADEDYVYWLAEEGLMRLSTDANPGDSPEVMNATPKNPGEIAVSDDRVYLIHNNFGGDTTIGYVRKSDNGYVELHTPSQTANDLQVVNDWILYQVGDMLIRQSPAGGGDGITNAVTGYYAEGRRLLTCNINTGECTFTNRVYIARGRDIHTYDLDTDTLNTTPIYQSPHNNAVVYDLVTNFNQLFFYERRPGTCSPQPCIPGSGYVLLRRGRGSSGGTDAIYNAGSNLFSGPDTLHTNGSYLFFRHNGGILRLPSDVAALPQVNVEVTGMEITQGVQSLNNDVVLVKNRRTFVRVYVRSDDVAVPNVTARLSAPQLGGNALSPVNSVGDQITVRPNPNRNSINQSFLFELPWNWTQQNTLELHVNVNPYQVPLEPNYGDNTLTRNVSFDNSPTLSAEFFRLNYDLGGTTFRPRIAEDVLVTYSFIQRLFPIGGAIGDNFKPRLWNVAGGAELGAWVNQSDFDCILIYPDDDLRNLCASYFTNGWLNYYRIATFLGLLNVGLDANAFYYGMISDGSGNFPRGQAIYSRSSVGPTGTPCAPFGLGCGWDSDGTYADWYAAHEMGHSLGRAHPNAGSDNPGTEARENCGHSRSDPGFPYGNTTSSAAPIGPADGSIAGFEVGDPSLGIDPAVLPSTTWNDVMSYCNNQWISDYTYEAIYNYMMANPSGIDVETAGGQAAGIAGDFLFVSGVVNADAGTAGFNFLRRMDNVASIPPLEPGGYAIRLVDSNGGELASHAFTPEELEDVEVGQGFAQVVDFAPGTRGVQIVRLEDGEVLVSAPVSANAPVVSNVQLQDAPSPVTGVVTLVWEASDADDDALSFEVSYSRDDGATFQPVAINITENSAQIDTAQLGGSGEAILRVTASDGVNQGFADSAAFTMSNKPPQPFVLGPEDGLTVQWGQLVNFSGVALDAQDGTVADDGLEWRRVGARTALGTGALISVDDLPVGENVIRFSATNSVGETASAEITIIVVDDLSLPGPTLSVGPTKVAWQIPAGENAAQNAELIVNNTGSGSMNWTASSNQAWLQVSAEEGTVPADGDASILMLTADPSGLDPDMTHAAEVTITGPTGGDNAPSVVVPVALSIGDVRTVPFVAEQSVLPLFVPTVQR